MTIQEALDYCLENPEGLGAEELLGKFPEYREELAPLLGLASDVASLAAPGVPAARRAAMKARIVRAASATPADLAASTTAPTQPVPILGQAATAQRRSEPTRSRRPVPWYLKPGWVAAAAAMLLVAFVWWSAANALPDSPFYGVRLASESVTLGLSGSQANQTSARIALANNRLYDLRAMQDRGLLAQARPAFESYQSNLNNSVKMWRELTGQQHTDVAELLYPSAVAGQVTFQGFAEAKDTLPADLAELIRNIEGSLSGANSEARQALVAANVDPAAVLAATGSDISPLLTPVVANTIAVPTLTATGQAVQATNTAISATRTALATATSLLQASATPTHQSELTPTNTLSAATSTPTATRTAVQAPTRTATRPAPTHVRSATPRPSPTRRPPAPSHTPTIHVEPTATETPFFSPTVTPVPPAPSATSTVTVTATVSATPTPSDTPAPPTPVEPNVCDLRIRDVSTTCPGGCVEWRATVENRGGVSIDADWTAELQIMVRGGGFEAVTEEHGSAGFSPGDNIMEGSLCYDYPPNTVKVRVEFYIDTEGDGCHVPSHKSRDMSPCS